MVNLHAYFTLSFTAKVIIVIAILAVQEKMFEERFANINVILKRPCYDVAGILTSLQC